ncbi:MAG: hypothetical protein WCO09_04195 [bacterium]
MKSQPVKLTQKILSTYLEGQVEILSGRGKNLHLIKIRDIKLEDDGSITIFPTWIAKGESHKVPGRWTMEVPQASYSIPRNHDAANIGPSVRGGGDRITIVIPLGDKIYTFYPQDGKLIDMTKSGIHRPN